MGPSNLRKELRKRKTMKKKGEYEKISEALYVWFVQKREAGASVSSSI